jgi:hypothetical protein
LSQFVRFGQYRAAVRFPMRMALAPFTFAKSGKFYWIGNRCSFKHVGILPHSFRTYQVLRIVSIAFREPVHLFQTLAAHLAFVHMHNDMEKAAAPYTG